MQKGERRYEIDFAIWFRITQAPSILPDEFELNNNPVKYVQKRTISWSFLRIVRDIKECIK